MSEIKLKPCPFCGNRNLLLHQTEYQKRYVIYRIPRKDDLEFRKRR